MIGWPGNLHSTALEEDLNIAGEDAKAGGKVGTKGRGGGRRKSTAAASVKKQAASLRKSEAAVGVEKSGRKRKSVGEKVAAG